MEWDGGLLRAGVVVSLWLFGKTDSIILGERA